MPNDPLADLGLDLGADAPREEVAAAASSEGVAAVAEATAPAKAPREEVEIGELEFGEADFIPASKRGGPSGSKYDFDKLTAPVLKDANDASLGYRYSTFTARLQPGVDADKLKRSVQSATTAANRAGKDEGKYFVTRTIVKDGEFVGITVFRVDGTQEKEGE